MKGTAGMKAYTDYPFMELGDKPHQEAPIRCVTVLNYDGNKYCEVAIEVPCGATYKKVILELKAGYLYKSPGRLGEVEQINTKEIVDVCTNI